VFSSNTNSGNGGAIAMDGPDISVLIDGCTFTSNTVNVDPSQFRGGAISGENGATVEIRGSTFMSNVAYEGDALYLTNAASYAIRGSTFVANGHSNSFGCVRTHIVDSGVIEDCLFDGNFNAIYTEGDLFALDRTTVENDHGMQGAVIVGAWNQPSATISDSTFRNNDNQYSSVLNVGFAAVVVERCVFADNAGTAVSGSGVSTGAFIRITDSEFSGHDSVVSISQARVEIESSLVYNNRDLGNGTPIVHTYGFSIRIVDSIFQSNDSSDQVALQFLTWQGTDVRPSLIENNLFEGNSATGYAVEFQHGSSAYELPIRHNVFRNNVGGGNGAVHLRRWGVDGGWITFFNNLVQGNQAMNGGGLYVWDANEPTQPAIRIHSCTLTGNTATQAGGGVYLYNSKVDLENTVIWGNTDGNSVADGGDDLYVEGTQSQTLSVDNCDIGTAAGKLYDPGMRVNSPNGFLPGTRGNLSANPLFVTGPDGVYYLSQVAAGQGSTSPCVNAGSTTAAALGLDLWTTRTDGVTDSGTVDLGYHYAP
jgi:parallel beta-helix repeat protein